MSKGYTEEEKGALEELKRIDEQEKREEEAEEAARWAEETEAEEASFLASLDPKAEAEKAQSPEYQRFLGEELARIEQEEEDKERQRQVESAIARQKTGRNIKEARKTLGLTQEKLAELVGTSNNYIAMIENGKRQGKYIIDKIAKVLNVSIESLGGIQPMPAQLCTKPLKATLSEVESIFKACIPIYDTIPEIAWETPITPIDYLMPSREAAAAPTVRGYIAQLSPMTSYKKRISYVGITSRVREIKYGDIIVVDTALEPKRDDIIIAGSAELVWAQYYDRDAPKKKQGILKPGDEIGLHGVVIGIYHNLKAE